MTDPLISIVVVTYKRYDLLADTIESLKAHCNYPRLEWIVCDDGSPRRVQEKIELLPFDHYLLARENGGIGFNTNKGMKVATGEFILHLQDDWHCDGPEDFLHVAIELMRERDSVSMVQFWREANFDYPSELVVTQSGRRCRIFHDKTGAGCLPPFPIYSDRPHLKRRRVLKSIGYYEERKRPGAEIENDYCRRFASCPSEFAAIIDGYGHVFRHTGESQTFMWPQRKENWRRKLKANAVTRTLWHLYTHLRYGERR